MSENTRPLTKLYAVLSVDQNGNEGIVVMDIGGPKPAVTGDPELAGMLVRLAREGRSEVPNNLKIVLAEFDRSNTTRVLL